MKLEDITPLILTYNEEPNLDRCLGPLSWARRVVVLDSGSSDATASIAKSHRQVDFAIRPFDDHTTQWNHGLDLVDTDWVLALDADYVIPREFVEELSKLPVDSSCAAYFVTFRYVIHGKQLRSSLYPPRAVLFRKSACRYREDGHTQTLQINGPTARLVSNILHDDRKSLHRWLSSQDKYARLESHKLLSTHWRQLPWQDRMRRAIVIAPWLVFVYTLIVRGALRDGWRGWFYATQRMMAEMILSLHLLERCKFSLDT